MNQQNKLYVHALSYFAKFEPLPESFPERDPIQESAIFSLKIVDLYCLKKVYQL